MHFHELRVNEVRNEMMDDDSSFLATDFGWWWSELWVGLILDQEVRSRSDWAAQEETPHEETLLDVCTRRNIRHCARRAERVFKEGRRV